MSTPTDLHMFVANKAANNYWESKLPAGFKRPGELANDSAVWKFIQDKYLKKKYVPAEILDPVTAYLHQEKREPAAPSSTKKRQSEKKLETTSLPVPLTRLKRQSTITPKIAALKGDFDDSTSPSPESSSSRLGDLSSEAPDERDAKLKIESDEHAASESSRKRAHRQFASAIPREFTIGTNAFNCS